MNKSILLLGAALSFNCFSATEIKGSPEELKSFLHPEEKTITITREASETVFKDVAIVSIVVTTEDDKLSVALKENAKLRNAVSARLSRAGIPLKNINNSKFSTSPDYGWFGDKPDSYKVSNVIAIRIAGESGLESIAQVVDQHKEITLHKTEYEHSKKEAYINKIKAKALDDVLSEKAFYANKLGINLKAVSFRDNNAGSENDIEVIEVMGYRKSRREKSYSSIENTHRQPSFEKVTYKATVSVSFKVE